MITMSARDNIYALKDEHDIERLHDRYCNCTWETKCPFDWGKWLNVIEEQRKERKEEEHARRDSL